MLRPAHLTILPQPSGVVASDNRAAHGPVRPRPRAGRTASRTGPRSGRVAVPVDLLSLVMAEEAHDIRLVIRRLDADSILPYSGVQFKGGAFRASASLDTHTLTIL